MKRLINIYNNIRAAHFTTSRRNQIAFEAFIARRGVLSEQDSYESSDIRKEKKNSSGSRSHFRVWTSK